MRDTPGAITTGAALTVRRKSLNYRIQTLRKLSRSGQLVLGAMIWVVIVFIGLFPGLVAPHPYDEINMSQKLMPPVWAEGGDWRYPLGTDGFGRDLLSRIIYGATPVLTVAVVATILSAIVGIGLGLIAGYAGGVADLVIIRIADAKSAIPTLIFSIAFMSVLSPSVPVLWMVMTFGSWIAFTRVIRGQTLSLREEDYILASRAIGAGPWRIVLRHILPNLMAPITVLMSFRLGGMILLEGSLSFLGLGVPPPAVSWGRLLAQARPYITTSWWVITFPGLALMLGVLGANQLGDGLRDVMDPRLRGRI